MLDSTLRADKMFLHGWLSFPTSCSYAKVSDEKKLNRVCLNGNRSIPITYDTAAVETLVCVCVASQSQPTLIFKLYVFSMAIFKIRTPLYAQL